MRTPEAVARDIVPLDHTALASVAPSYERMRLAIAECWRIDEVAKLADQAVAAQAYYRQSQDHENEAEASRIRLRAERRLGEILTTMVKSGQRAKRDSPIANVAPGDIAPPTLEDLGIPRDRASRAMQLAELPETAFEAALAAPQIAQPRRILDDHKAGRASSPAAGHEASDAARTTARWVQRVLEIHAAIGRSDLPRPKQARMKFSPADVAKLRGVIPSIIRYLEQVRVQTCPSCDGEGCAHCGPAVGPRS